MPFDPSKPADHSPDSSAEMRAQLNGLKDLIDAQQIMINGINSTLAALSGQINALTNDTPHNCASVSNLSMTVGSPPQPSEVQGIADKVDELLNTLRR